MALLMDSEGGAVQQVALLGRLLSLICRFQTLSPAWVGSCLKASFVPLPAALPCPSVGWGNECSVHCRLQRPCLIVGVFMLMSVASLGSPLITENSVKAAIRSFQLSWLVPVFLAVPLGVSAEIGRNFLFSSVLRCKTGSK